jgi:hypothetical protein
MNDIPENDAISDDYPLIGYSDAYQTIVTPSSKATIIGPHAVDALSAKLLGVPPTAFAESVTFHMLPDPWVILDLSWPGPLYPVLWRMEDLYLTYVRAIDQPTGIITCYITLSMYQTAYLHRLESGGHFHILSKNTSGGLLEDWDTGSLDTKCSYHHELKTYTKNFRPDWYDLATQEPHKHQLYLAAGTWTTCHRTGTVTKARLALETNEALFHGSPVISMSAVFDRGIQRGDCLIEPGARFTVNHDGSTEWDCWVSSGDSGDFYDGEFHIKNAQGQTLFITGNYRLGIGPKDKKKNWKDSRGPNPTWAAKLSEAYLVAFACSC